MSDHVNRKSGQPNYLGETQYCVYSDIDDKDLTDMTCDSSYRYICEVEVIFFQNVLLLIFHSKGQNH